MSDARNPASAIALRTASHAIESVVRFEGRMCGVSPTPTMQYLSVNAPIAPPPSTPAGDVFDRAAADGSCDLLVVVNQCRLVTTEHELANRPAREIRVNPIALREILGRRHLPQDVEIEFGLAPSFFVDRRRPVEVQLDAAASRIAVDRVDLPELHVVDLVAEKSVRRNHVLDGAVAQEALLGRFLPELLLDRAPHTDVAYYRPERIGQAGDLVVRGDRPLVQHL